jgi:hypothetical protein
MRIVKSLYKNALGQIRPLARIIVTDEAPESIANGISAFRKRFDVLKFIR